MRITLTHDQSQRYATGDPAAWEIEEALLAWADVQQIPEPSWS